MPDLVFVALLVGLGVLHVCTWGVLLANLAYLRRPREPAPSSWPPLSVCIPARNEAENLRRLLPSLLTQTYPEVDIHVWDDGSEDETWAVLQSFSDEHLYLHHGSGPPTGWLGKVHALYQCSRRASGDCYLFLDADARLTRPDALKRLVARHQSTEGAVTSTLPLLTGAASLLVSLVPHALLTGLPWPLVRRTTWPALSALNGQCWLIDADVYHAYEPHEAVRHNVLEDVAIGRLLKEHGQPPALVSAQDVVSIYMYTDYRDAWRGFRKNAYLLLGGTPGSFAAFWTGFVLMWVVAPLLSPWFLASLYGLKGLTDHTSGVGVLATAFSPVSFVLGAVLQFDSALHHWTDRVRWKGRSVPASASPASDSDPPAR